MLSVSFRGDMHRRALAIAACLWLSLGSVTMVALDSSAEDCCCGGESFCLLRGEGCDSHATKESSPCGGLRAAKDLRVDAAALAGGLQVGALSHEQPSPSAVDLGRTVTLSGFDPLSAIPSIDPPPPQSASVS